MRLRLAHSDFSAESYNIVKQPFMTTVDARGAAKILYYFKTIEHQPNILYDRSRELQQSTYLNNYQI